MFLTFSSATKCMSFSRVLNRQLLDLLKGWHDSSSQDVWGVLLIPTVMSLLFHSDVPENQYKVRLLKSLSKSKMVFLSRFYSTPAGCSHWLLTGGMMLKHWLRVTEEEPAKSDKLTCGKQPRTGCWSQWDADPLVASSRWRLSVTLTVLQLLWVLGSDFYMFFCVKLSKIGFLEISVTRQRPTCHTDMSAARVIPHYMFATWRVNSCERDTPWVFFF